MFKKLVLVLLALMFSLAADANAKDYSEKLAAAEEKLSMLQEQVSNKKDELQELSKWFADSDIALRQDLISIKTDMDEKTHIRESKRRQAELKQEYQEKRKPLKAEYDKLRIEHRKTVREIKSLNKKIDRLAGDPYIEIYNQKIAGLRQEVQASKDRLSESIANIYNRADIEIAKITDMDNKSRIRNQILTDAKIEELALRKENSIERQAIADKIAHARKEHRDKQAEFRQSQAATEIAQPKDISEKTIKPGKKTKTAKKSSPAMNFTTAR
jgi:hypothetical protein